MYWCSYVCSSDLLIWLPVVAGIGLLGPLLGGAIVILLVPAFYWIVRTMLTGAAIVAERPLGAVRAVKRSIALTRGNGLVLAALIALVTFAAELVAQIFVGAGALMASANAVNPIAMAVVDRSEEHTSELQSLMHISYAVFC